MAEMFQFDISIKKFIWRKKASLEHLITHQISKLRFIFAVFYFYSLCLRSQNVRLCVFDSFILDAVWQRHVLIVRLRSFIRNRRWIGKFTLYIYTQFQRNFWGDRIFTCFMCCVINWRFFRSYFNAFLEIIINLSVYL